MCVTGPRGNRRVPRHPSGLISGAGNSRGHRRGGDRRPGTDRRIPMAGTGSGVERAKARAINPAGRYVARVVTTKRLTG